MVVKEVCVDNLKDAVHAYEAGANRIEYCSDLDQDGLTPNLDELLTLSKTIPIPIRCMLRPHSNSFVYNNNNIKKMVFFSNCGSLISMRFPNKTRNG